MTDKTTYTILPAEPLDDLAERENAAGTHQWVLSNGVWLVFNGYRFVEIGPSEASEACKRAGFAGT